MAIIVCAGVAFALGAIPFGWLIARRKGIDIKRVGSGNIGATNVSRALGRRWGVVVFLLDFAKGFLPVLLARTYLGTEALVGMAWVGAAAVAGHVFSPVLKFRGGKGVATAFGAFFILQPWVAVMAFGSFMIIVALFSYIALGSVMGALIYLLGLLYLVELPRAVLWPVTLVVIMIVARHGGNIVRMVKGTENKVQWDKKTSEETGT